MIDFKFQCEKIYKSEGEQGFTLVELMITVAISLLLAGAVYTAYSINQKSYYAQGQVVKMQQNIRAALELMSSEIRMAGFDPDGEANAGIVTAGPTQFNFTMDLNDDGDVADVNENITYTIGGTDLTRNGQTITENIQNIEFYYSHYPNLNKPEEVVEEINVGAADLKNIRSVKITILAVAEKSDPNYTNTKTYTTASNVFPWTAPGDGLRRRLLSQTVNIRNRGF